MDLETFCDVNNDTDYTFHSNDTNYTFYGNDTDYTFYGNDTDSNASEHSSTTIVDLPYYSGELILYGRRYARIHGYISILVCGFGIIANIVNMIVLTRKNMISITNVTLTGLAFADTLVQIATIPFKYHYYLQYPFKHNDRYTYGWAVYEIFYNYFTNVLHTISISLTLILAIWRYMAVCYPLQTVQCRTLKRAKIAIALTYILCPIFYAPFYFTFEVERDCDEERRKIQYYMAFSEISQRHDRLLEKAVFWIIGVISKLVPCLLLAVLSFGLIRALYKANTKRKKLVVSPESRDRAKPDTTTKLLLVVLLLFIMAEFPYGMVALLSGVLDENFKFYIFFNLLETMEDLILINASINFVIYCSMSKQFRETFVLLFSRLWSFGKKDQDSMKTKQVWIEMG